MLTNRQVQLRYHLAGLSVSDPFQTLQSGISSCIAYLGVFQAENAAPHTPMPLQNQNSQKR